jgi:hypothetical protein
LHRKLKPLLQELTTSACQHLPDQFIILVVGFKANRVGVIFQLNLDFSSINDFTVFLSKITTIELSRPEICHLVGEICADKSLKLLKKQLNGNFYSFTGTCKNQLIFNLLNTPILRKMDSSDCFPSTFTPTKCHSGRPYSKFCQNNSQSRWTRLRRNRHRLAIFKVTVTKLIFFS